MGRWLRPFDLVRRRDGGNVTLNITGGNFGDYMGMNTAKFGDNVTVNAGTFFGAVFGSGATFGSYCTVGGDMAWVRA